MYRFGKFSLDPERLVLSENREPLNLPPKAVRLLCVLAERAGAVVTKGEMMDRLWPEGFVEESNLTQYVYLLRKTLAERGAGASIQTVPRRGYRFVAEFRTPQSAMTKRPRWLALLAAAVVLATAGIAVAQHRGPARLSAHDRSLYQLGRYYWNLRSPAALHRSVGYFDRVARDAPNDALGFSGLADAYLGLYDYDCDGNACLPYERRAKAYAVRAVAVDGNSAEAHTSLAMALRVFDRNYAASDREFARAIALDASYALAYEWYGNSLLVRGRIREALTTLQRAAALDPVAPATYAWLSRAEYYAHSYRSAVAYGREALAIDPSRAETRLVLGLSYEQLGDDGAAIEQFRSLQNAPALVAGVEARRHDVSGARSLLAGTADNLDAALDLIALGDASSALNYLRRVRFSGDTERAFFALDPRLDSVRHDARFKSWTKA